MITDVHFGYVKINGALQTKDFIIHDDVVTDSDWKREHGHVFEVEDIPLSIREKTQVLIIATGMENKMKVSSRALQKLKVSKLDAFIVPTDEAADIYNEARRLRLTGITGAFHTRC